MFYVTSNDGSQQELLTKVKEFDMTQDTDGTFQVSFFSVPDEFNAGYDVLQPEAIVNVDGYDFRVKLYSDLTYSKSVTAVSTFYDLDGTRQETLLNGVQSINEHAALALASTGWSYTIDSSLTGQRRTINNFGKDNAIALVAAICKHYSCEYEIFPNKRVHFTKEIGPDNDHQYRYGVNVKTLREHIDTNNLRTQITGYGATNEEGEQLVVTYTSPNYTIWGIRKADDIEDSRFTNSESLLEYIKLSLVDEPEMSIELDVIELTSRMLGERIWLIYEPLNIVIHTRILSQNKGMLDGKIYTKFVTIGNARRKSQEDSVVQLIESVYSSQKDIVENKKIAEENLAEAKEEINETIDNNVREINYKFQETDRKIVDQYTTITTEYSASISVNAREIRTEMNQKETTINNSIGAQYTKITAEYNSSISQTAQAIRTDVTASITSVNANIQNVQNYASSIEQTAQQIQYTVWGQQTIIDIQGTRISYAESSITQQAHQISQKVSQTDFNGNTISSLINQTAYDVTINAQKINFQGEVFGQGATFSGNLSTLNDAYVGRNIVMQGGWGGEIRFPNSDATIYSNGGTLGFRTMNTVFFDASTVDFSATNVVGLNTAATSVNGYTMTHSTSGTKKFITFRQYGSYLGQVELA